MCGRVGTKAGHNVEVMHADLQTTEQLLADVIAEIEEKKQARAGIDN